jgi:DNA-binding winged helix-turn-helix (wHTH) protein/TolB-like protein
MTGENKTNGKFYRCGELVVDLENFRVRKNGATVDLTPRAFDVLVFLIESGGRVVEKRELFEKIWQGAFVGDNALTKVVREIRLAVGDDALRPRFIETVPKRGYRFIAQTSIGIETDAAATTAAATAIETLPTDADALAGDAFVRSFEETDSPEPKPNLSRRRRQRQRQSNRRFGKILLGAAGAGLVAIFLIISFIIISEWRAEIAAANAPIDSVAVLPFANETGDDGLEYLSEHLAENVINSLAQVPNLRVLPRNSAFPYKAKAAENPQTAGRMLRVRAVLTGKITRHGDALTAQVELVRAERKAQLWGRQFTRPASEADRLSDEIARAVAGYFTAARLSKTPDAMFRSLRGGEYFFQRGRN